MAPIDFADFLASEEARRETWRRRFAMEDTFREAPAEPRPPRRRRARPPRQGRRRHHPEYRRPAPGLRASPTTRSSNCTAIRLMRIASTASRRYELAALRIAFERDETAPICDDCGGYVKTATISFGQAMPVDAMRRAEIETLRGRSVHRRRLLAGGLSGGRLSGTGETQWRDPGHHQPRADRSRPHRRSRAQPVDRRNPRRRGRHRLSSTGGHYVAALAASRCSRS